jgi:type IV pilus assembly protein PilX
VTMYRGRPCAVPRAQVGGFSLIVALLLMVALSFIGVSALRNVSLQEKMAGNLYYRTVSMHESEGALRFAQQRIASAWATDAITSATTVTTPEMWSSVAGVVPTLSFFSAASTWANSVSLTSFLTSRPINAQYVVEQLDSASARGSQIGSDSGDTGVKVKYFRSSARAVDPATNASVVTQEWAMYPTD